MTDGMAACGTFNGTEFKASVPAGRTFHPELKPISEDFVPETPAVSGLDHEQLVREGPDPAKAMRDALDDAAEQAELFRNPMRWDG